MEEDIKELKQKMNDFCVKYNCKGLKIVEENRMLADNQTICYVVDLEIII